MLAWKRLVIVLYFMCPQAHASVRMAPSKLTSSSSCTKACARQGAAYTGPLHLLSCLRPRAVTWTLCLQAGMQDSTQVWYVHVGHWSTRNNTLQIIDANLRSSLVIQSEDVERHPCL